jgi:hypothetical protein
MQPVWITGVVSVFVAVLAAILAHLNNRRLAQRQEALKWVNAQLEELYGPLLALSETGTSAWNVLRTRLRPSDGYILRVSQFTEADRDMWVAWMRSVFMPTNRKSVELITTKAHLMLGGEIPQCLLDLCAHVAGYEVVIQKWDTGDYSELLSVIDHPRAVYRNYVRDSFLYLKGRQQRLLVLTGKDRITPRRTP